MLKLMIEYIMQIKDVSAVVSVIVESLFLTIYATIIIMIALLNYAIIYSFH